MHAAQKGACSTISASQPALLRDCFRLSISDKSESVIMLLHALHWSCGRSCSRSRDTLDLWDPGSWGSELVTAWASLSFWSLASRRSRARWSGRWHRFSSIGSVVTSLVLGTVGFLEDPSVDVGSVVSFFSSFSFSSSSSISHYQISATLIKWLMRSDTRRHVTSREMWFPGNCNFPGNMTSRKM